MCVFRILFALYGVTRVSFVLADGGGLSLSGSCLGTALSFRLFVLLSFCLFVFLSFCFFTFSPSRLLAFLSLPFCLCLFVPLSLCPFVSLSLCLFVSLSLRPSVFLSSCLRLSVSDFPSRLSVFVFFCPFPFLLLFLLPDVKCLQSDTYRPIGDRQQRKDEMIVHNVPSRHNLP